MRFWDSSALMPLVIPESMTERCIQLADQDSQIAYWWAAPVEVGSGLERRFRAAAISASDLSNARLAARRLFESNPQVDPSEQVRVIAHHLLRLHPLRAADALQLAAAMSFLDGGRRGLEFVCLDDRLRAAALSEGATVLP